MFTLSTRNINRLRQRSRALQQSNQLRALRVAQVLLVHSLNPRYAFAHPRAKTFSLARRISACICVKIRALFFFPLIRIYRSLFVLCKSLGVLFARSVYASFV